MKKVRVKRFGWLLQAKPKGAMDSAYVNVWAASSPRVSCRAAAAA